ncbi:MAG TPA: MlaD family protein [Solirubrobacteraceae bacterium]|nr:MlaD family protein [Solirubrobacteraceae bacterium]
MRRALDMSGRERANWAVAIGIVALVGLFIWFVFFRSQHKYIIYADFYNSDGIIKDSDVKIGGVAGGEVASLNLIKVGGQDVAQLKLAMGSDGAPIGQGASAAVRPANLLGEKYVDLNVGNLSKPLRSGSTIPVSRTSYPVEIDDVLNVLQPDVRASLRLLINEAGVGLDGQGTNFNTTLTDLPPALDQTNQVVGEIAAQDQTLKSLITNSDQVISSISTKRKDLQTLIGSANSALTVTARNRAALGRTLGAAPSTLSQVQTSLGYLRTTATNLIPASEDLRKASAPLAATLQALPGFQAAAKGTLATIEADSPTITHLGVEGSPIVARLKPTVDRLNTFAQNLTPNINTLSDNGMAQLLGLMSAWVRTIQDRDSIGHVFRIHVIADPQILTNSLSDLPSSRSTARKHLSRTTPTITPTATAPTTQTTTTTSAPTSTPSSPVSTITSSVQGLVNGVTGLLVGPHGLLGGVLHGSSSTNSATPATTPTSTTPTTPAGSQATQANSVNQLLNYLFGS